jgi:cell division protein FtsB
VSGVDIGTERRIRNQLLISHLRSLEAKINVVTEPYVELKNVFASVQDIIVGLLQDYKNLQAQVESLTEENRVLREKIKKLEGRAE